MDTKQRIHEQVTSHPVVLFMKGTPQMPQCGFSQLAAQVLNACGVQQFHSANVLPDNEIPQAKKEYANWPTIPQLYVNGEFVGGSDIMREMYESGELQKILDSSKEKPWAGGRVPPPVLARPDRFGLVAHRATSGGRGWLRT